MMVRVRYRTPKDVLKESTVDTISPLMAIIEVRKSNNDIDYIVDAQEIKG